MTAIAAAPAANSEPSATKGVGTANTAPAVETSEGTLVDGAGGAAVEGRAEVLP